MPRAQKRGFASYLAAAAQVQCYSRVSARGLFTLFRNWLAGTCWYTKALRWECRFHPCSLASKGNAQVGLDSSAWICFEISRIVTSRTGNRTDACRSRRLPYRATSAFCLWKTLAVKLGESVPAIAGNRGAGIQADAGPGACRAVSSGAPASPGRKTGGKDSLVPTLDLRPLWTELFVRTRGET